MNDLNTTCLATVSKGASINTPGNVAVTSTATDQNSTSVQTASYFDGLAGLTGAAGLANATVHAYVDGTIIAGGHSTGSEETFNPFQNVDFANSRLVFTTDPGYVTGEQLTYSSDLVLPIPGLSSGTDYYAIVSNSGGSSPSDYYVQLAASASDASSDKFIAFGQYPTITATIGGAATTIPITSVDTTTGNDNIQYDYNPGFTEGQTVTVTPASGNFLGYDDASGDVHTLSGTYTVHIVNSTVDQNDRYTIQLDSAGSAVQLDDNPYLTTASGQHLSIQGFDSGSGTIYLYTTDPGLVGSVQDGDPLVYHAALGDGRHGVDGWNHLLRNCRSQLIQQHQRSE